MIDTPPFIDGFNPSDWQGVLARPGVPIPSFDKQDYEAIKKLPAKSWLHRAHRSVNQVGPECVGHGVANAVELILGDTLDRKRQISGRAIHRRGREMYHKGNMNGGLWLEEGVDAAMDLGILPPDTEYYPVFGWVEYNEALDTSPLIQAHYIHEGWHNPDLKTGCINHHYKPDSSSGGHCTVGVAMGYHEESDHVFSYGANSWGFLWGMRGFFCMTVQEWDEGMLDYPLALRLSGDLAKWDGWRKYVE